MKREIKDHIRIPLSMLRRKRNNYNVCSRQQHRRETLENTRKQAIFSHLSIRLPALAESLLQEVVLEESPGHQQDNESDAVSNPYNLEHAQHVQNSLRTKNGQCRALICDPKGSSVDPRRSTGRSRHEECDHCSHKSYLSRNVCWVTDDGVRSACDEFVILKLSELKGKVFSESVIACNSTGAADDG